MVRNSRRQSVRESRFWQAYDRRRYAILFYALLLTLLVMPILAALGLPAIMIKALVAICLVAAVMPNSKKQTRLIFLAAIAILIVVGEASEAGYVPVRPQLILALVGATGLAAAAGTFRFAVTGRSVTAESLYAALSTYLLAGLFFGQIYWSIETIHRGSVVGPDPTSQFRTIYYSFITLATLGYGDYVPRTDVARGVATFEVIGGQLFLAVLVARLIGAFGVGDKDR